MQQTLSRRAVVGVGAGAALTIPFAVSFTGAGRAPALHTRVAAAAAVTQTQLGAYIQIGSDNTVTVSIGSSEMGQGIMTGMGQLVAEELQILWSQVRVVHALADAAQPNPYANPLFYAQVTGGSTSTRGWYLPMRQAAAIARDTLLQAAALLYGGSWSLASGGMVTDGTTTHPFSDLVAKAATLTPPTSAALATTNTYIGKRMGRVDIPSKVHGAAKFGIDVRLPGMVYASVIHCPTLGGTVASMPATATGALAVVNLGDCVGVVANDTWSAMNIANSLASRITWTLPTNLASRDSAAILATAQNLLTSTTVQPHVYETTGVDPAPSLALAKAKIDQTYTLPYLAHACMEVLNCTASVTATSAEVWAPTQGQQFCIYTVQAITGLPTSAIKIHTTMLGGGLGRKIEQDYISQAVTLAKAVGKPVKLTWSRPQDFKNDKYRPCASIRVQAGANSTGAFTGLIYRNVSPSINIQRSTTPGSNPEDTGAVSGALALPYNIVNRRIEFVPNPADIPLGYWRSVGESYNTFAVECAIDELALAAGVDSMAFRKKLVSGASGDPRALTVLNLVDTLSGWSAGPPPAGRARGMAFLKGFGSYIALVAEISLNAASQIQVNNMYCAIDCGVVVNPGSVEAQMQGGVAHGLAAALWGQVTFANGVPNVNNFSNYRMLRLGEMPTVSVKIAQNTNPPGGVGETGVPCVAPALANAYAKLTGTRVRTLPFYPGATMSDG
jgi:isoquinoline 1-oxidoreductase subunit beta